MPRKKADRIFILGIFISLSLFGLLIVGNEYKPHWDAFFGRDWLPTSAQVIEFKTKSVTSGGRSSKRYHEPVIHYEYTVRGFRYSGDRVCWKNRPWFDSEREAREFAGDPKPADSIVVRYNSKKPHESILKDKVPAAPSKIILMGMLLQMPMLILIIVRKVSRSAVPRILNRTT